MTFGDLLNTVDTTLVHPPDHPRHAHPRRPPPQYVRTSRTRTAHGEREQAEPVGEQAERDPAQQRRAVQDASDAFTPGEEAKDGR